jgi:iron(III) transport system ATP-binding protein
MLQNRPSPDAHLELVDIVKNFSSRDGQGEVTAVNNVSLSIQEGEFLTLLGPSGCGKTTTLRLIAGFEMPSSGRILLDGENITNQPPNKRDMALVFQSYALFPHMSVFDNIAYGLQIRKLSRQEIRDKVGSVMRQVGLTGLDERRPNELSGGQQQRVALARSLVMEPKVLLFDEPLSNLDAKLRVQMRSEIRSLQRRMNITGVYVTHDQVEAMALSDRIVVMNAGIIEQIGSPAEIYRHPQSHFVADFIGQANFITTPAAPQGADKVEVHILGKRLVLPFKGTLPTSKTLEAVLRPQAIRLVDDMEQQQAQIEQVMYLGSEVEYQVMYEGKRLIVIDNDPRSSKIFEPGRSVGIDLVEEAIHLLPKV